MTTIQKAKHAANMEGRQRMYRLAEEAGSRMKRRGGEILDEAQDQGERALKGTREWISEHPGAAVSYGFLAGATLASLFVFRRNRND